MTLEVVLVAMMMMVFSCDKRIGVQSVLTRESRKCRVGKWVGLKLKIRIKLGFDSYKYKRGGGSGTRG